MPPLPAWSRRAVASAGRIAWASRSSLQQAQLLRYAVPLVGVIGGRDLPGENRPPRGEVPVELEKVLLTWWDLLLGEDRLCRTLLDAQSAVDTFLGIDYEHIRCRMEAVHRTDFDAVGVFASDAVLGDYVCHGMLLIGASLQPVPHGIVRSSPFALTDVKLAAR